VNHVSLGALEQTDRRTQTTLTPIVELLTQINSSRALLRRTTEIWLEEAVMVGILARIQAIPKQLVVNFSTPSCFFCRQLIPAPSWSAEIPGSRLVIANKATGGWSSLQ
jgi:hypothetical protein